MINNFLYYIGKKKFYGFAGLALIAASFFYYYLPFDNFTLLVFNSLFYLGNILFFDYLSFRLSGSSLLHSKHRGVRLGSHLLLVGFLFGTIFEFYAHWLAKLYYYPYWSASFFLLILIPGWAFYCFYLLETYLGTKAVLEFFFKPKKEAVSFVGLKKVFTILGVIGSFGLGALTIFVLMNQKVSLNIQNLAAVVNTPIIDRPFSDLATSLVWTFLAVFLWLIFEYLEYKKRETSMLYEMIRGNFAPVLAVFLSAWFSAILYEVFNISGGLWRYQNMPFASITIFTVPLFAYILWPFHYFPLFSLYRLLFKKDSEEIWK